MRAFWENLPLRAKVLSVVAVPVVPLLVVGVFILMAAQRERDAEQWVRHTLDVKTQIEATLTLTADANASVEAFLLTRQRDSLTGFMTLGQKWPETLARLVDLVRDNPSQVERLEEIAALQGRNPLTTLVQYGETHATESVPPSLLAENESTILTFRDILSRMHSTEDQLLEQRMAARQRAQRQQEAVALGGSALGILGSVVAAFAFAGGVSARIRRVRDNAALLADGRELLPATSPRHDEIGALARDIRHASSLLKAREQELEERVAELAAVNHELEAFSYSVSHDLRAPLRHITGFASLLEATNSGLDGEDRRRLKAISDAATRMGRLIDDLLTFSRMGRSAVSKRRVRLEDLVKEARKEVAVNGSDGKVAWTIHPLPEVEGDAAMLHLVFVNLIGNAVKYVRPGERPSIEIGADAGAEETVVFVRDQGVGFDMQYAHKLFGVFQRLHSSDQFDGTGIGLANVRRIIHRHGGRTWAEGTVNAGATFYFSLPKGASLS